MARFLVTGGAGYIGSHTVLALRKRGDEVVVVDDLRQGHRRAVADGAELIVEDVANRKVMDEIFANWKFDGILHFAALSLVGESMKEPLRYIRENVNNTLGLAEAGLRAGCDRFVLSSTAAIFGLPVALPIAEGSDFAPVSAYGESKFMAERGLAWAGQVHGLRSACLRYFNAAGADPEGELGEDHSPETHLIPLAINAALGLGPELKVFGTDYDTPDGTCIRDYVHVSDLADAHLRVLGVLDKGTSASYNVGNGSGYSVKEVIEAVSAVSGRKVPFSVTSRRPGDPAILIASSAKLRTETGWAPRFGALNDIVRTAWNWRSMNPSGFSA